jgi:hypothetical protein
MSLYPGEPRTVAGKQVLDDEALKDSLAKAVEDAMDDLLFRTKGAHLPEEGREDRRLLFAAVARGVLKYLSDHQGALRAKVTVTGAAGTFDVKDFNLAVTMSQHTPHS